MPNDRVGSRGRFDATTLQGLLQQLNSVLGNLGSGAAQVNGLRLDIAGAVPTAAPQDAGSPNLVLASNAGVYSLYWWTGTAWATAGGGGVTGSGTIGKLPKWATGTSLSDSLFSESGTTAICAADLTVGQGAGLLDVKGTAPHHLWWETDAAVDERRWRMYVDAKTFLFETLNDAFTLAQNIFQVVRGAGIATTNIRFNVHIDFNVNNTYDIGTGGNYPRNIMAATGIGFNGSNVLDFTGGVLRLANSATWTSVELRSNNVLRATLTSAGVLSFTSPYYDFTPAVHVSTGADQAAFNTVQANVTGLTFTAGVNEVWDVDVSISCTMTAATGVKFYFTGPAAFSGEWHGEGNVATLPTWQSLYQAVVTVPGTFFITGAITGRYRIKATIRTAGTGGAIQLVGITGAGATCVVKKGSSLIAHRTT